MKIYKTSVYPSRHELHLKFNELLNSNFRDKINQDIDLNITENENGIEIGIPALYTSFLYRVNVKINEIWVTKSEHYTDDVNTLTLEDIIGAIIVDYVGEDSVKEIQLTSYPENRVL